MYNLRQSPILRLVFGNKFRWYPIRPHPIVVRMCGLDWFDPKAQALEAGQDSRILIKTNNTQEGHLIKIASKYFCLITYAFMVYTGSRKYRLGRVGVNVPKS